MAEFIKYANQEATRNLPLSPELVSALSFLPELGMQVEVFSGGQPEKGSGKPRVGSTRHDLGHAADVFFYKDGRRLDWGDPRDIPLLQEIVIRGKAAGLTGFGAGDGYMQPGSMHIGFGNEAVWGAGGKGENAPDWLRSAYYSEDGAPQQLQVAGAPHASQTGAPMPQNALSPQPQPTRTIPENAFSRMEYGYELPVNQFATGGFDQATNPFLSYMRPA